MISITRIITNNVPIKKVKGYLVIKDAKPQKIPSKNKLKKMKYINSEDVELYNDKKRGV